MLRFNDGMSFDTSGELRVERRSDGLYVVGRGMMFAVDSYEEGKQAIDKMNARREASNENAKSRQ